MSMSVSDIRTAIDKLEAAKLELALGKARVSVGYDGKNVSYQSTDLATINSLIAELKGKLYALGAGPRPRRGFQIQF